MVVVIVVVVIVVVVGIAAFVLLSRRGTPSEPPTPAAAASTPRPEPAPMTGLEDALNRATDRSGATMAQRIDAEADKVAGLREPDDTGPILRRALDRVDHATPADQAPDAPADEAPTHTADDA